MEEERKNIDDSKIKFSGKIKGILAALLFALGSSNFSYAQEADTLNQEIRYEGINFKKMNSYIEFDDIEHVRQETVKYRNSIFEMTRQLFTKDDRFGFHEFDDICEEAKNLLEGIENEENYQWILNNLIRHLEYDISVEKNVECRQALTKILSIVKDKKNILNGVVNDPIELLKQNLKVGDIILINKKLKSFDIGSDALKFFDEKYLTDFTHVLIFIGFDEYGNIMVRHSTTETERLHKIGVEETSFLNYLFDPDRCDAVGCDVIVLRPIPEIRQSILDFSERKIGFPYDSRAALRQGIGLSNNFNDRYNCVELITNGIRYENDSVMSSDYEFGIVGSLQKKLYDVLIGLNIQECYKLRGKTHPNDILKFPRHFELKYISSFVAN